MTLGTKVTRRGALLAATGAAAACAQSIETPPYEGAIEFAHGVASGDPQHDRVVIWTRVTPERAGPAPVRWIVARNRDLTDIVKTGVADTNEARDYTVKVDVTGLRPGAPYFYGFRAGAAQSAVGRTKTLPRGRLSEAKLAVVSCASFPHGFFNAYEALAQREDIDAVVHLGDYIYEYGLSGYGGDTGLALGRVPQPEVECTSLGDYRQRHALYKREAELQAAHAIAPWIVVWDDHETANNTWSGGAENHNEGEGEFAARKQAALQAYYEWMPIRDPQSGRAFEAINRSFQFGDLLTLIMLESRLLARNEPVDYARQMPIAMQRWDFANPSQPVALRDEEADTPAMRRLPAIFEVAGSEIRPVLDWRRAGAMVANPQHLPAGFYIGPDIAALNALLAAPDRALLGEAQEAWLGQELAGSVSAGAAWQVLGNQVLMAQLLAPDLSNAPPALVQALERLRPGVAQLLSFTRWPIPVNPDGWDGYAASRTRVLEKVRAAGGNALVVTGDTHTSWANEIDDGQGRVAVEFGASSVTSPSDASYFTAAGVDFDARVRARNPHIKYTDGAAHGFIVLTLTREQALAEFFNVSTILSKEYDTTRAAAFTVAAEAGPGVGAITAA